MKILIFSDCHWGSKSSIIRSIGNTFSTKLEYLIKSLNWVNTLAIEQNCQTMYCAGDFMDKSILTDEELTALSYIKWNNLPCYFICGNHESSVIDLRYSSLKALENSSTRHVIWKPTRQELDINTQLYLLPYITESNKQELSTYLVDQNPAQKTIIISHNDIAGINYGGFESVLGFSVPEIEQHCDLYLNGHLHNTQKITNKVINVGSISGHNFTNDSFNYSYGAWVIDTDTLQATFYENPYSINFYKLEIKDKSQLTKLNTLKANSAIMVKTYKSLVEDVNNIIKSNTNIIESRILIEPELDDTNLTENKKDIKELQGADHISRLIEFCKQQIPASNILDEELAEICK